MSTSQYKKVIKRNARRAKTARGLSTLGVRKAATACGLSKSTIHRLRKNPFKETVAEKRKRQINVILEAVHQLKRKSNVRKVIGYDTIRTYVETHMPTCGREPLDSMKLFPSRTRFYALTKLIPIPESARRRLKKERQFRTKPDSLPWYGLSSRELGQLKRKI